MKKLLLIMTMCGIGICGTALLSDQIPDIKGKDGFTVEYKKNNGTPTYNIKFQQPTDSPTIACMINLFINDWENGDSTDSTSLSAVDIMNGPSSISHFKTTSILQSNPTIIDFNAGKKIVITPRHGISWGQDKFVVLLQTWHYEDTERFRTSTAATSIYSSKTDDLRVLYTSDGFTIIAEQNVPDSTYVPVSILIIYTGD